MNCPCFQNSEQDGPRGCYDLKEYLIGPIIAQIENISNFNPSKDCCKSCMDFIHIDRLFWTEDLKVKKNSTNILDLIKKYQSESRVECQINSSITFLKILNVFEQFL